MKKIVLIVFLLVLASSAFAWKPATHVYLASQFQEDMIFPAAAIIPDITSISSVRADTHNPSFIDNMDRAMLTAEDRLFFQAYYHHIHMDPKENVYNSKYFERLKHDHPGYDDHFYREAISYGAEFYIAERYPDVLTLMVASVSKNDALDSFAGFLLDYDSDAEDKVRDFKDKVVIYTSTLELQNYELVMERELSIDLSEEEWNDIMTDAKIIAAQEFEDFARITNSRPPVNNWVDSGVLTGKSSFSLVKGSSTSEKIGDYLDDNPDMVPDYFTSYDKLVMMYIEQNPSKVAMIVIKFALNHPGSVVKFLLNPKAGLGFLIIYLISAFIPAFFVYNHMKGYRNVTQNLKNVVYVPIVKTHNDLKYPSLFDRIKWGNVLMLVGISVFLFSTLYDYIFSNSFDFGIKQWVAFFLGLGLIIVGYSIPKFISSISNVNYKYIKKINFLGGAILFTGLVFCLLVVFYDMLRGWSFHMGLKQVLVLMFGVAAMLSAFIYTIKNR